MWITSENQRFTQPQGEAARAISAGKQGRL
jgi:hypothetical protein